MKYARGNILDSQNSHKKKFLTHEILTRKNYGPKKYLWERILDPKSTLEKKGLDHRKTQWHNKTRPTIPTMGRDPQNLAH